MSTDFFDVSIQSPSSIPDTKDNSIALQPGMKTTIRIDVTQLQSTSELYTMPLEERKCQFMDENQNLDLFKVYTQANCLKECEIKYAAEKCGCIPWSVPQMDNAEDPKKRICDYFGNACFMTASGYLNHSTANCNCPYDCSGERYTLNVMQTKLDSENICKNRASSSWIKNYILASDERFIIAYSAIKESGLYDYDTYREEYEAQYCREKLENDLGLLKVVLASKTLTRLKQSKKVSMAAQLSTLGNTSS